MRINFHKNFKRDVKKLRLAGWDMEPLEEFLDALMKDEWPLPKRYEAHPLHGDLEGTWDIHLRQNWLVFFRKENDAILLLRTGTHAHLGIG